MQQASKNSSNQQYSGSVTACVNVPFRIHNLQNPI